MNLPQASLTRRSFFRRVLLGLAAAAVVLFLVLNVSRLSNRSVLPVVDFVEYWAAGRLCMAGGNPYSWDDMLELEKSVGMAPYLSPETGQEMPLMMYNPPWTLAFIMPLAQPRFALSRLMALIVGVLAVVFCADWIWKFYGGSSEKRWWAWLVGLSFVPTLQVLQMGQIGPLLLFGVVGFLYAARSSDWAAGVATVLIAIKPHLFGILAVAILLWAIYRRHWSVFAGAAVTVTLIMACLLAANPHLMSQYLECIREHSPRDCRTPTLGALVRWVFGRDQFWLQVLPLVVGVAWGTLYWLKRRNDWDWSRELPLLLVVSLLTAPYGAWPFDLVVLLLPVIEIAAKAQWASRAQLAIVAVVYGAIEVLALAQSVIGADSFCFVWMPPALLLSYLGLRFMLSQGSAKSLHVVGRIVESSSLVRAC
jgi:Glycosyltransferase family 87